MRIHQILPLSWVNGPGARFTVWVQGCSRRCKGCFNPLTHDAMGGFEMSVSEIVKIIPSEATGITLSGGEPFEQPEEIVLLLDEVRKIKLHTLVYTGFQYEDLKASQDMSVQHCLSLIDMLIDGEFREGVQSFIAWAGSGNQRLIELNNGEVSCICDGFLKGNPVNEGEIIIDKTGVIVETGFFCSSHLQQEG